MSKHFELTSEKIRYRGKTLYRIRAIKKISVHNVKKGDLGGYVESLDNLSDNAWVSGKAMVYGNAKISENALIADNAVVFGNSDISGDVKICGNARVFDNPAIYGNAKIYGDAKVYGNAYVSDNAKIYGDAWIHGDVVVEGSDIIDSKTAIAHFSFPNCYSITVTKQSIRIGCKTYTRKEIQKMQKAKAVGDGLPEDLYLNYKSIVDSMIQLVK